MEKPKKKKCCNCRRLFLPDHRNRNKQEYCDRAPCRKASKVASQKKWLGKPENADYFLGPDNIERVQKWRQNNPSYWKRTKNKTALQDLLTPQVAEKNNDTNQFDAQSQNHALQDLLTAQPAVIIGLISNIIGSALQDDIASTLLRMEQSGQEILFFQTQNAGGYHDHKSTHYEKQNPPNTQKLQLGRSPVGQAPIY
ncbi:MAG: hypothetical protein FP812_12275 [Desulfobacula sp.]|nr:hypothetical protein [Desulfobacula sp.]